MLRTNGLWTGCQVGCGQWFCYTAQSFRMQHSRTAAMREHRPWQRERHSQTLQRRETLPQPGRETRSIPVERMPAGQESHVGGVANLPHGHWKKDKVHWYVYEESDLARLSPVVTFPMWLLRYNSKKTINMMEVTAGSIEKGWKCIALMWFSSSMRPGTRREVMSKVTLLCPWAWNRSSCAKNTACNYWVLILLASLGVRLMLSGLPLYLIY